MLLNERGNILLEIRRHNAFRSKASKEQTSDKKFHAGSLGSIPGLFFSSSMPVMP